MTDRKKPVAALIALALLAAALLPAADWKEGVRAALGARPDYAGARALLDEAWPGIAAEDRGSASLLRAYVAARLNDPAEEWTWLVAHFEAYGGRHELHLILGDVAHQAVMGYLTSWASRYPRVLDIAFAAAPDGPSASPPRELALGVDMARDALFKLGDDRGPVQGGAFHKGWNVLTFPTPPLDEAGTTVYTLDLKSGPLAVRKTIRLDVDLMEEVPAVPAPSDQHPAAGEAPSGGLGTRGYTLSLYLDDELILSGTKFPPRPADYHINLPPLFPDGYKPWLPPDRQSSVVTNSGSVLDALGAIAGVIKDLLAKRKKEPSFLKIPKTKERSFTSLRFAPDGRTREVRIRLRLQY